MNESGLEPARAAVIRAMNRLLDLGGVDARSQVVEAAGTRLHFLEAGQGSPLVLLQGAGGGAANWYRVMGPLAEHFRVLALDLPGFGLSGPVPIRAPLGPNGAAIVSAWLDSLGIDRCDLVGTSFGGLIALRLAKDPARVRRLVLLDSVGLGRAVPLVVRLAALPGIAKVALRPSRPGTAWLFRWLLTTERGGLPTEHQDALIDYLTCSAEAGDPYALARALRLFTGLLGQREVLSDDELAAIAQPTLVAWGERDRFLPAAHGARASALIPRGRFQVIPRAGHSPNWEAPAQLVPLLLDFLAKGAAS